MVRSMEYPCLSMAILKKTRGNLIYWPWEGHGKPMAVPWIFHNRYNKTMVYYQISMVNPWNWPWKVNGNPMDFLWSWPWIPHWVPWELDHWYSVVNLWNIFVRVPTFFGEVCVSVFCFGVFVLFFVVVGRRVGGTSGGLHKIVSNLRDDVPLRLHPHHTLATNYLRLWCPQSSTCKEHYSQHLGTPTDSHSDF